LEHLTPPLYNHSIESSASVPWNKKSLPKILLSLLPPPPCSSEGFRSFGDFLCFPLFFPLLFFSTMQFLWTSRSTPPQTRWAAGAALSLIVSGKSFLFFGAPRQTRSSPPPLIAVCGGFWFRFFFCPGCRNLSFSTRGPLPLQFLFCPFPIDLHFFEQDCLPFSLFSRGTRLPVLFHSPSFFSNSWRFF